MIKQITWMCIGLIFFFTIISIGYRKILDMAYLLYGTICFVLLLVLLVGNTKLGATRWFNIGPFSLQPSEFAKIVLILIMARYLGNRTELKRTPNHIQPVIVSFILMLIPFIFILKEPDLGTSLVFLPVYLAILLVWGVNLKYLTISGTIILVLLPFLWSLLEDYQKERILVFINPDIDPLGAGYTIIQSKIAIGSGCFLGQGWRMGSQSQLNFLPERHSDFIFSSIGEEAGFIGSFMVLLLYFVLIALILSAAYKSRYMPARLIAVGVAVMIAFQIFVNIGMTFGIMPVVGLPLPLMSYGGSSLITIMIALGLVISIKMDRV